MSTAIGHISAANQFVQWKTSNQLSHAYLLSGTDREELHEQARGIIAALLCDAATGEACGSCASCRTLASDNHVGVSWVSPDGASLKIAQMRTAVAQDQRRTQDVSDLRIHVLEDVHKLTPEAANAILKWIEEPYPGRLFLLLTTNPAGVLATIRSRCALFRVAESDKGSYAKRLQDRMGMAADRFADTLLLVLELTEALAKKRPGTWRLISLKVGRMNYSPEEWLGVVDLLVACFRDASAQAVAGAVCVFTNDGDRLQQVANHSTPVDLAQTALRVAGVRRKLLSHVNAILALEAFCIEECGQG